MSSANRCCPQEILVAGEDVLDGPVTLEVITANGALRWDDLPVQFEEVTGARIVMTRRGSAGRTVDVLVRTTMETISCPGRAARNWTGR